MEIVLPEIAIVLLLGPSGSGKTTFAKKHFPDREVLHLEEMFTLFAAERSDNDLSADALDTLHFLLEKRLKQGLLTVVDGDFNTQKSRMLIRGIARKYPSDLIGIWLDLPESVLAQRQVASEGSGAAMAMARLQTASLEAHIESFLPEGFHSVHRLQSVAAVEAVAFQRTQFSCNQRELQGPFDIIGDVHGCLNELESLLEKLGYQPVPDTKDGSYFSHPEGRTAVFLGDLISRGPHSSQVVAGVMEMVAHGSALCVQGNHEASYLQHLAGEEIDSGHGMQAAIEQMAGSPLSFQELAHTFMAELPPHLVLDQGRLVVAHAGLKARMHGRQSADITGFARLGETTGPTNELGREIHPTWAEEYDSQTLVVHGHVPVPEPTWTNKVLNLDTGCVFGGKLSAFRYPERELVTVAAAQEYAPFTDTFPVDGEGDNLLGRSNQSVDFARIAGQNLIGTTAQYFISIKDDIAPAVLDNLVNGGISPAQLIYLPPLLSPTKASTKPGYLEHPHEAFTYYAKKGMAEVVVEEIQGGARTTLLLAKDQDTAHNKLSIKSKGLGTAINSSGAPSFQNPALEQAFIERFHAMVSALGLWESLNTDWICVEGELLPGSTHWVGMETIYQRTKAGSQATLNQSIQALKEAQSHGLEVAELLTRTQTKADLAQQFGEVLDKQNGTPTQLEDFCFVPSLLLASEGNLHFEKHLSWHLSLWSQCGKKDPLFMAPKWQLVQLDSEQEKKAAVDQFESLSQAGKPGILVRSPQLIFDAGSDLIQPALKVRGKEYLRLVYGLDYDLPENLEEHRKRRLKDIRQLTVRQLALGYESLKKFVEHQDVNSTYECIFALLSLQTQEIDPRQSF